MHTYGCRVIQRVLEHFPESATDPIYDQIISHHIPDLCQDQFGNYVIQHILDKGKRSQDKKKIWESLIGNVRALSVHKYASNVVEKCIEFWAPEDKAILIDELLGKDTKLDQSEDTSLFKMMDNKYGNYVVQKAVEGAKPSQRIAFYSKIKSSELVESQQSNYVKHVINCLDRLDLGKPQSDLNANAAGVIHTHPQHC